MKKTDTSCSKNFQGQLRIPPFKDINVWLESPTLGGVPVAIWLDLERTFNALENLDCMELLQ